ncbi:nicotinate-nucleotide--dimethylbenzimidazole phosphoribosyltransferase [Corynebacterium mayonis]|uniref:nicotinate-nucleotide--dimethylbenzimidazole phosphoribosyltransferase n=1 Tax=Corynebacterium mayonis TaxID=3062461 RepID=UPI003140B8D8
MSSPLFDPVSSPDVAAAARLGQALEASTRGRSLGRLGELAAWIAACQSASVPSPFHHPCAVIFAGRHGVAARGISAFADDAASVCVAELAAGGGPGAVAARAAGCGLMLVDDYLTYATRLIDVEDAMSAEEFAAAVDHGKRLADREIDAGADLLIAGDVGVGNTTIAATVYGALTRTEPVAVIGRGSGIDDETWKRKVCVIRDAMFRVRNFREDLSRVLAAISAPDFVALTAFIAQSAVRRTPVLVDATYTSVATYVAERLAPGTRDWVKVVQLSAEPSHTGAIQALGTTPVLALDITTGQATGALLTLPLLNAAAEMVGDELSSATA